MMKLFSNTGCYGLVLAALAFAGAADAAECRFAGASYSAGGTFCECPRLFNRGENHTIIQHRLICRSDGAWDKIDANDADNRDTCAVVAGLLSRDAVVTLFRRLAPDTCQVNSEQ